MRKAAFTLVLVGVLPAVLYAHQFYISITTIQHDPNTEKLSVQVKIFVNDLEECIYQAKGVRLGLWFNKPIENAESYVEEYIEANLSISINNAHAPLQFISQEVKSAGVIEDHVIICQFEASGIKDIEKIKVRNSLLLETFDSQANIVNLNLNDTRKTINLDSRLPEDEISYN